MPVYPCCEQQNFTLFASNYDNARANLLRLPEWHRPSIPKKRANRSLYCSLFGMPARSFSIVRSSFWPHSSIHAETSDSTCLARLASGDSNVRNRPASSTRAVCSIALLLLIYVKQHLYVARARLLKPINTRIARLEVAGANPTSQYRRQERAWVIEIRIQTRDDITGRRVPRCRRLRAACQGVTARAAIQLALYH